MTFPTPFGVRARTVLDPLSGAALASPESRSDGRSYVLPEEIALGWENDAGEAVAEALQAVREGRLRPEVRIGVGPLGGPLPARLLAYAVLVERALGIVRQLACQTVPITIFSSAPKSSRVEPDKIALSLAALGLALRRLGVKNAISLQLAHGAREIPLLPVTFPTALKVWVAAREERYASIARDDLNYAMEHAAETMFGDLSNDKVFRFTIGGANEGPFWAVRTCVRAAAVYKKMPVVPAVALIFPAA